jgi:TPR repeat protein
VNRGNVGTATIEEAVQSMLDLSRRKFPPAMFVVGMWEMKGEHLTANASDGLALIQKAAARSYGPALYEVALRRIEGRDLSKDTEKGLDEMRRAATLGSPQAQLYLGNRYDKGDGVPREADRASWYFRLCAAHGIDLCEYRLAKVLLDPPNRPDRDYVQAVAWLQLAGEQGLKVAQDEAASEVARLTPTQRTLVDRLRPKLVRDIQW